MSTERKAQAAGFSALGKLPSQGDFVRVNAGDPAAQEFARWLEGAHEALQRNGTPPLAQQVRFIFSSPAAANSLVGVLGPSRDAVGRVFPLSVFAVMTPETAVAKLSRVPLAFHRFYAAAGELLAEVATLTARELADRLSQLASAAAPEWALAELQRQLILGGPARDLLDSVDSAPPQRKHHYAFQTFLTACNAVRGQQPQKTQAVLECPVRHDGPMAWIELAQLLTRWTQRSPTMLWTEGEKGRLLICLGPPGLNLLDQAVNPGRPSSILWPLTTSQPTAMDNAMRALSAGQRVAVDDVDISLGELLEALAG